MSVSGNDGDGLLDGLVKFTGCISEALGDICSVGLTIGEAYVPFKPDEDDDCEMEEEACEQAWVRVMTGAMAYADQESFEGENCGASLRLSIEVGVLRCFETSEDGEAPTATDTMAAALQSMLDMKAIYCAAMSCEAWDSISSGTWVPNGPLGGQYGGVWTFDVEPSAYPLPDDPFGSV